MLTITRIKIKPRPVAKLIPKKKRGEATGSVFALMLSSVTWGIWDCESPEGFVISAVKRCNLTRKARNEHLSRKSEVKFDSVYSSSTSILSNAGVQPMYYCPPCRPSKEAVQITWGDIPFSLSPPGGKLPLDRWARKTLQVECMMVHAMRLIHHALEVLGDIELSGVTVRRRIKVVEFCAGSGFVALPLAHMFPKVDFVLVDRKLKSMDIARERIHAANIHNVRLVEGNVEEFIEHFDVGIALHACGSASDYSLQQCLDNNAAFVVCPCCIGKILHYRDKPLSSDMRNLLTEVQFKHVVRAADFGHTDSVNLEKPENKLRRVCKSYVEEDRRRYAVEHGYESYLFQMPIESSPKNDIIVGWPAKRSACSANSNIGDNDKKMNAAGCIFDQQLVHLFKDYCVS